MKSRTIGTITCALIAFGVCRGAQADILVGADGRYTDGKIVSASDKEIVIQPDGAAASDPARHVDRARVTRLVYCDTHGAMLSGPNGAPATQPVGQVTVNWDEPTDAVTPVAPPIPKVRPAGPTYYIIPLHGEVGATVLASALEKSLEDAVARKPTVIILDINSPGGLVSESLKIMKVIGHYNRQARIIAFTEQDLSAAAMFTMSVKKIYVKPLSTIGAATSFIPGRPDLSAKVEEKMQSAWRAAARNSAEEGEHEPLLADAMIDNSVDLHLEMVHGQPVVKEGVGEKMILHKGKILTLSSREAVACGLAAGSAEDLNELAKVLGYSQWTECPGLGTILADYLPKQNEAFEASRKKIIADFGVNMQNAANSDPTGEQQFVEVVQRPIGPPRIIHGPMIPGRPGIPGQPYMPGPQIIERRIVRSFNSRDWKQKSLACVVSLELAEANLNDAAGVCNTYGHDAEAASIKETIGKLTGVREKIYSERNKYGIQDNAPVVAAAPPVVTSAPPPPATPRESAISRRARNSGSPDAAPATDNAANAPVMANADTKLKQIEKGWQPTTAVKADLMSKLVGRNATRNGDGPLHITRGGRIATPDAYAPTVTFRIVAMTSEQDIRIGYGANQIIFNWEMDHDWLRVDGGPVSGRHKKGAGRLPKDEWVGIELNVTPGEMTIYVDGVERYRERGDFSQINQTFTFAAHGGDLWIKSFDVIQAK